MIEVEVVEVSIEILLFSLIEVVEVVVVDF